MTDLTSLTLAEARDRLVSRAISSVALTTAHLDAIERAKGLNAFVAITAEKALAMAEGLPGEIYVNGGKVLPHKSISTSVPEPQIIM